MYYAIFFYFSIPTKPSRLTMSINAGKRLVSLITLSSASLFCLVYKFFNSDSSFLLVSRSLNIFWHELDHSILSFTLFSFLQRRFLFLDCLLRPWKPVLLLGTNISKIGINLVSMKEWPTVGFDLESFSMSDQSTFLSSCLILFQGAFWKSRQISLLAESNTYSAFLVGVLVNW